MTPQKRSALTVVVAGLVFSVGCFVVDVVLAPGDWWTHDRIAGGTTVAWTDGADRIRYPLFVREGAILPMTDGVSVWPGRMPSTFARHDEDEMVTTITLGSDRTTLSRVPTPTALRVHANAAPAAVTVNGMPALTTYDATAHAGRSTSLQAA